MIFQTMFKLILDVVQAIFSILPTVPATPSAITSAGAWVTTEIGSVSSVLRMIYGSTLYSAIILVIIGVITFEWIYHSVMWLATKLPMLGIKR